MKRLLVSLILLSMSGCSIVLDSKGEWGVKQSTSWALYHDTENGHAEAGVELHRNLWDWLLPTKESDESGNDGTSESDNNE